MPVTTPIGLQKIKTEFSGPNTFSSYIRSGTYVPNIAANSAVSTTVSGLAMSQFLGATGKGTLLTPGYNGLTYDNSQDGTCGGGTQRLVYFSNTGTWEYQVQSNWPNLPANYNTLASGSWVDIPNTTTYEFRLSSLTNVTGPEGSYCANFACSGGYPSAPTAWTTIGSATEIIFGYLVNGSLGGPYFSGDLSVTIEVREVGQTSPVQVSTIRFTAYNTCY